MRLRCANMGLGRLSESEWRTVPWRYVTIGPIWRDCCKRASVATREAFNVLDWDTLALSLVRDAAWLR
jgi:hypothetical protein